MQAGPFAPELLIEHPDALTQLHREFLRAGAEVLQTMTFYARDELGRAPDPLAGTSSLPIGHSSDAASCDGHRGRTLTARATTRIAVTSDTTDSTIMVIFAHVFTGSVSVGLNAVALVNDRLS